MIRLLVVDDEPMIRKGLVKLIEQSSEVPLAIATADNGVEALELMSRECPQFLFTDIRMPRMDGLELCRRVSEQFADTQIVVISGYDDFAYAQKCLSYGVKEYLLKPVNKKNVRDVLDKLVARMRRQTSNAYISLARLEQWVENMEEAIWSLHADRVDSLLAEYKEQLTQSGLSFRQQIELLEQSLALLVKKLNARDVFRFVSEPHPDGQDEPGTAFDRFSTEIKEFLRLLKSRRRGNAKDPVEEAKHYIEQHLTREISLDEVAELLGLNPSYFSQLFKQMTGETFVQYRIKRRMEKAKKLLENPSYRVTDISYEVGYADHPHFTKTFKKYTGYSPSEYREMLGIE